MKFARLNALSCVLSMVAVTSAQAVTLPVVSTVYSFIGPPSGPYSAYPMWGLIAHNGFLYGTTNQGGQAHDGGTSGNGTVYRFDPATGQVKVIYSFSGSTDGSGPTELMYYNGSLYGNTTSTGYMGMGFGTIYKVDLATGLEKVLYTFTGSADGGWPDAYPIQYKGYLFGTAQIGGRALKGVVYRIDPATGSETVLHNFTGGSDGAVPVTALVEVNGSLYGTTSAGGTAGKGVIFQIDPVSGQETVLYNFQGAADGASPGTLLALNGKFYGTAGNGGEGNNGTIFEFDPATGTETTLFHFSGGSDGGVPTGRLTFKGGYLYGSTATGGTPEGCGTLFRLNLANNQQTVLYRFNGLGTFNGPPGGVAYDKGNFYGVTYTSGAYGFGTIFEMTP